jgi:hypothetical protein
VDKREYFIRAMAAGAYRYKRWVIEAFSVALPSDRPAQHPLPLIRDPKGGVSFIDENGDIVKIDGADPKEPLFRFRESVQAYPGNLPNIKSAVMTTYGNLLLNQVLLVHAFGDRFDYIVGDMSPSSLHKLILPHWSKEEPKPGEERNPKKIYTDQFLKFQEAGLALSGYATLCVVSSTPKTMTTDPRIPEVRARLLEEYKDRLHDPVIQAKIEGELKKIDREWVKGDPAENFYIKGKSYDVVRKKLFLIQGTAEGFGEQGEFIPGSLEDGWDIKYLPAMGNALRDGSYSRGAQTALGGEVTKFNYRIFQNTSIVEDDCGSKMGMQITLTEETRRRYISSSIITAKGLVLLDESNVDNYIGKSVLMRYPTYCHSRGANFCATCAGKNVATTPNAISTYMANIGSLFMALFMKAMHGKALKIVKLDFHESLS